MKQSHAYAAAFGAAMAFATSAMAAPATDPTGVWLNDTGRGAVEIKPCGNGVCGFVVAVKDANDTKGCGKQIIGDAQPVSGGRWDNGWIYSPEKRKNYDVELKPLADGTLRVVGYAGTKLFSRTMIWTPAPADMKRCDAKDAAAPSATEAAVAPPKDAPVAANDADKPAAAPPTVASTTPAPANVEPAKPAESKTASTGDASPKSETAEAASEPNSEGGEKPGERSGGDGLKIGSLDLDKVLTRTASGKCKLDLPWVKVQFDCERE